MLSERFLQDTRQEDSTDRNPIPPTVGPQKLQYSLTSPGRPEVDRTPLPHSLLSNDGSPREMENVGGRAFVAEPVPPPYSTEARFEKLRQRLDGFQPSTDREMVDRDAAQRKREPFVTPIASAEPSPSVPKNKISGMSDNPEPISSLRSADHQVITENQQPILNPLQPQVSLVGNTIQRFPLMKEELLLEDSRNCTFEVQVMNHWTTPITSLEKGDPFLMSKPPMLIDSAIAKDVNNGYEKKLNVVTIQPNGEIKQDESDANEVPKVGLLDRFRLAVQRMQVQSQMSATSNRFRFYFPELASVGYTNKNRMSAPFGNTELDKDCWLGEFQCTTIHNNRFHEGHVIVTDKHLCFIGNTRRDAFLVRSIISLDSIIGIEECTKKLNEHQLVTSRHQSSRSATMPRESDKIVGLNRNSKGNLEDGLKFFTPIPQRGDSVFPEALQIYFLDGTLLQLCDLKSHIFCKVPTQKPVLADGKPSSSAGRKQEFHFGRLSGDVGMHQTFHREATDLDRFEALLEHAWRNHIKR